MDDKIWLKHYDEGVPLTLAPYPECTLLDVVAGNARSRPNHPALLFEGNAITYSQLEELSGTFARALVKMGVKKGDRVAFLLPNTPQLLLGVLGAWKAGAIVVPLNPLYTDHELEFVLNESGAETAVVLTPFYEKLKGIQAQTRVRRIIATNVKEYLPLLKRLLFTLAKEKKDGHRIQLREGDAWLGDVLRQFRGQSYFASKASPADPAVLLFSGGTTGTPKAALGMHHGLFIAGTQLHSWFTNLLTDWDDIIMLNMPLFHAYGLVGVFATGLVGHNTFALIPNPRDIKNLLATITKIKPAFLPGVPTLFNAILSHPDVKTGKAKLRSLKLCISGAAPLMAETKQRFESITGGRIVEAYALTESMLGATVSPVFGVYKAGSIGIPVPDVDVRIVDTEAEPEVDLATGQVGEIVLHAPQIMAGYWNKPDETSNILRDGWLYTGDIGYQDEDGYIFIVDRKKDLIKPGGFQVWPRDVEEVIASHPAVAEVCVAGIPNAQTGEAVKAWVVLQPGSQLTSAELRAYCREKLVGYKVPKYVEFCDSLPKTTVGKILRRELVARERAKENMAA